MVALGDILVDRRYVSQYSLPTFGLRVEKAGDPADADGIVGVMYSNVTSTPPGVIFNRAATRVDVGVYEVTLSSVETSITGLFSMAWSYAIDGIPQTFVGNLEVGVSSTFYDSLDDNAKGVIESAYIRFADLFDSPNGGPNLQVYFQSNFGRGRMAQLLNIAVQRLNTIAQPHSTYSLDPAGKVFPYSQWGGLLDQALYIECVKHLIRSYVEQPEAVSISTSRLDRRDYMDRWRSVLDMEQADFKSQLDVFKIANMGLGRPAVMVSGGAYGTYGGNVFPGTPAQPRYWARAYA